MSRRGRSGVFFPQFHYSHGEVQVFAWGPRHLSFQVCLLVLGLRRGGFSRSFLRFLFLLFLLLFRRLRVQDVCGIIFIITFVFRPLLHIVL